MAGNKTQTRTPLRIQPPEDFSTGDVAAITNGKEWAFSKLPDGIVWPEGDKKGIKPPSKVGDVLYVRETFKIKTGLQHDHHSWVFYKDGGEKLIYWQDGHRLGEKYGLSVETKWKPNLHMPKWAARNFARVTAVRTERCCDITPEDVLAEGLRNTGQGWGPEGRAGSVDGFRDLIESIYPNIWKQRVWVRTLEKIDKEQAT